MVGLVQILPPAPLQPSTNPEGIITLETIQKALSRTVGRKGMAEGDIDRLGEYVMNFFGYSDYVIDNALSSEDRDVFYMLEEEGILTTSREEVSLLKGKLWRIHYWILKKRQIHDHADEIEAIEVSPVEESVYETIDSSVWLR